ncbi:RNase A-like domain-containing protein [Streptomyces griseosporeus]|uniref:RNase A-like domain-containing protein n=1 Tax=Streptomyces griseosporeus TaxID=1910 RepID=UPI00378FA135
MSVVDKARQVVEDLTGLWWPDADEDGLRDAAKAWRAFADDVDDVTVATNKAARTLIEHNKGEAISAFDDPFWRRYYYDGDGWLKDLADAARAMAKALDAYADAVHGAKKKIEHELEIAAVSLGVGTALAVFTFGLSEGAALGAATMISELAAGLGVAVTEEVATIAGTTLATAAFAGVESVTVDLAVAQPMAIALGEQQGGLSLDEAREAGVYGALLGGAFGGAGSALSAARNAGGWTELLGGVRVPALGPELALADGTTPALDDLGLLIKGDGEPNAWPRSKRKGSVNPKYRADLPGDEGKAAGRSVPHTLTKHVEVTTRDLRARLRAEPRLKSASRYIDEESAQRFTDAVLLKRQKQVEAWLNSPKQSPKEAFVVKDLGEDTGLSLSRYNFRNGLPPEWVKGATVVLVRDPSAPLGYRVLTSYPS